MSIKRAVGQLAASCASSSEEPNRSAPVTVSASAGSAVEDDVVAVAFDRKGFHRRFPFADASAVITSITPVAKTCKWIVQELLRKVQEGRQMPAGICR